MGYTVLFYAESFTGPMVHSYFLFLIVCKAFNCSVSFTQKCFFGLEFMSKLLRCFFFISMTVSNFRMPNLCNHLLFPCPYFKSVILSFLLTIIVLILDLVRILKIIKHCQCVLYLNLYWVIQ